MTQIGKCDKAPRGEYCTFRRGHMGHCETWPTFGTKVKDLWRELKSKVL